MKNIIIFDQLKFFFTGKCNSFKNAENARPEKEMTTKKQQESGLQSKFQLFDIDKVFAN
ncbi:hypothetical protein [Flavobacterium sp. 3HN19-14]|uniref:hypothetical protein n=1 Tax=Flavobacterium sp. 3HN19-14 TaxID=3448133 RepID=UPI003EDF4B33